MMSASFSIAPHELWSLIGTRNAPQLAGDDDHGLLCEGFVVYDALFAWLRFAAAERHNWPAKAT